MVAVRVEYVGILEVEIGWEGMVVEMVPEGEESDGEEEDSGGGLERPRPVQVVEGMGMEPKGI